MLGARLEEKLISTQNSLFIWKPEQNNVNFSHKQRQNWPNKTGSYLYKNSQMNSMLVYQNMS
jgi:hypothetical protein